MEQCIRELDAHRDRIISGAVTSTVIHMRPDYRVGNSRSPTLLSVILSIWVERLVNSMGQRQLRNLFSNLFRVQKLSNSGISYVDPHLRSIFHSKREVCSRMLHGIVDGLSCRFAGNRDLAPLRLSSLQLFNPMIEFRLGIDGVVAKGREKEDRLRTRQFKERLN